MELWFAKIERDLLARGIFTSIPDLVRKTIRRYITRYNEDRKLRARKAAIEGRARAVEDILPRVPGASRRSIHIAAALGDVDAAFALLDIGGASLASEPGGRRWWSPLLYVCASRYRREDLGAARAAIAERLLRLGASVTGRDAAFQPMHGAMLWDDHDLQAIEAAAGRAASPELVQALLDGGARLSSTTGSKVVH